MSDTQKAVETPLTDDQLISFIADEVRPIALDSAHADWLVFRWRLLQSIVVSGGVPPDLIRVFDSHGVSPLRDAYPFVEALRKLRE